MRYIGMVQLARRQTLFRVAVRILACGTVVSMVVAALFGFGNLWPLAIAGGAFALGALVYLYAIVRYTTLMGAGKINPPKS